MSFLAMLKKHELAVDGLALTLPLFQPSDELIDAYSKKITDSELEKIETSNRLLWDFLWHMKLHKVSIAKPGEVPLFRYMYTALMLPQIVTLNYIENPRLIPLWTMKFLIEAIRAYNQVLHSNGGDPKYSETSR